MPVVPRMDSPPTMPSRPFSVCSAISSPPGMEISTSTSPGRPSAAAASAMAVRIIARGTGLMAGSPGGIGRPGPRHRADARAGAEHDAGARRGRAAPSLTISAPCVTSGSSPASLTTPAVAHAVAQLG